ncbi:hypothetical protein TNIN_175041 [Trichonephila inaurata madagascariensis]|uniref:Uncharacterized protein n=1 Tax=Trichonephila inaurata madagascariensis TaxID=2747483 RepID=A0A8X7C6Z2_9ARAC|nr:hypothetical protein TNIN_175041 [Trichonephila inaurata madagascariensis]
MPEKVPAPETFKELSEAILNGKYKCLTAAETIDRNYLRGRRIDYLEKLGDIIEVNEWKYSYSERFEDLLDDLVELIIPRRGINLLLGTPPYVRVKISDDYFGIALKKEFCCHEHLNQVMNDINSAGLYNKWIDEVFFADTIHKRMEVQHEEPQLQLTLQDLKLAFFTLGIGYILAFLAHLVEILTPKQFDIFYS